MYEEFYFNHGLAVVAAGDFEDPDIFVIDENGNTAFDFKYDYARLSGYSEGMLAVAVGGDWGIGVRITGPLLQLWQVWFYRHQR